MQATVFDGIEGVLAGYAEQHRPGLIQDQSFFEFYATMLRWTATNPEPFDRVCRHYTLLTMFRDVASTVPGSYAECGVYSGLSTLELAMTYRFLRPEWNGRDFHVFDSFEGLSAPTMIDREQNRQPAHLVSIGAFAAPESHVRGVLHNVGLTDIAIYKGWIPSRFDEVKDKRFAFVHLDVDLYEPTRDSLEFFYPRLNDGGVIITDDYTDWPGARKAFDEYANALSLDCELTPTGQAYFRKGWRE